MKILVIVEKTGTGYSAHVNGFPIATTGVNAKELVTNMVEAINFYRDEVRQDADAFPKKVAENGLLINYQMNATAFKKL